MRPDHPLELPAADGGVEDRPRRSPPAAPIVLKPAEQTPLTRAAPRRAGARGGHPRRACSTSSPATARPAPRSSTTPASTRSRSPARPRWAARSAPRPAGALKRVTLELGGKSPNIILPDADLEAAIKGSFQRHLLQLRPGLQRGVAPVRARGAVRRGRRRRSPSAAGTTKLGPGLDPTTQSGPLVSAEQLERVTGYIDAGRDEAPSSSTGGGRPASGGGYFVEPTLFTDDRRRPDDRARGDLRPGARRAALRLARGGRRAGQRHRVRPRGRRVDARRLATPTGSPRCCKAGTVYVNGWGAGRPGAPFGGFKASGVGREHGHAGLEAYLETKTVWAGLG